jgi:processive 1,2-diacylglycerol beta-glucosyltransferase
MVKQIVRRERQFLPDTLRVVLLTTSLGAGHLRAAQAIEQAIQEHCPNVETRLIDSFTSTAPWLTRLVVNFYLHILAWMPWLYKYLYNWGNRTKAALWLRNVLSYRLAFSTRAQLRRLQPDVIVCSHASPTGAVCRLKKRGELAIPLIAVITDFVAHRLWIYDEVDIYMVAHEGLRDKLIHMGVAPKKIQVTGIPIDRKFGDSTSKEILRYQLGLDKELPTILIMGGGTGALPMDQIVPRLGTMLPKVQLLVVTGCNTDMRRRLLAQQYGNSVHIMGFVSNIHELMAASDLVVTKSGGMSSAEAIAMELPIIIYRPIPGQEEGNTEFLLRHGVACQVDDVEELPCITRDLLADAGQLARMREAARKLAKPRAAAEIANIVLKTTAKNIEHQDAKKPSNIQ